MKTAENILKDVLWDENWTFTKKDKEMAIKAMIEYGKEVVDRCIKSKEAGGDIAKVKNNMT